MRGLARSLVRDEHAAEDVAQEAWVTAMDQAPRKGFSLRAWLRGITRNHARGEVRGRQRRQRREQLAAKSESIPPGEALERVDLLRHVLDHVRTLDEPYRSTILQHYFDGISPREIARGEGVAAATIRTRLHRAILTLRARLDSSTNGDRRAWMAPLLAFAQASDPGPVGGVLEACRDIAAQAAQVGQHTLTVITMKKQALGIAALVIACLGTGVWFWQASSSVDTSRSDSSVTLGVGAEPTQDDEAASDLQAEPRATKGERHVAATTQASAGSTRLGLTVRGAVRDGAGSAISGVEVVAMHVESTRTDADGRYELRLPSTSDFDDATKKKFVKGVKAAARGGGGAQKVLEVRAIMKGYTIATQKKNLPLAAFEDGRLITIDFRLRTGFAVTGRVLDTDQQPIVGATVSKWEEAVPPAISDADGFYRLDHLDPSRAERWIQARADGYVASWKRVETPRTAASARVVTLDYVLTRGARLYGVVVSPSGKRVAGAKLEIRDKPPLSAVSNDDGEFEFVGVRAGEVRLTTRHEDYATVVQSVNAPPAGKELALTVELRPGASIHGTVVDTRGEAIAYAEVYTSGDAGVLARTKAALDGSFELRGLPANGISVVCTAGGYVSAFVEDVAAPQRGLRIVLQRSARIAGHVVDAFTSKAVTKFRVRFVGSRGALGKASGARLGKAESKESYRFYGRGMLFENDEGRWDTSAIALPDGFVTDIEVRAAGYAPFVQREVRATIEMEHESLRLAVTPGTVLRGRVLAADTALAIAGASVRAFAGPEPSPAGGKTTSPPAIARAESGAEGGFELVGVQSGSLRIVVEHEAHGVSVHEVQVPPGVREFDVTLRVEEQSTLSGVVMDSSGATIANVRVVLTTSRVPGLGHKRWVTTSDERGRFEFRRIPRGRYQIARMQDSGGPKQLEALCRYVRIDEKRHEVELSARGLATLHARFTSTTGSLPSGLYARIVAATAGDEQQAERIAPRWVYVRDGSVVVEGLGNGRYRCTSDAGDCEFEITRPGVVRSNLVLK